MRISMAIAASFRINGFMTDQNAWLRQAMQSADSTKSAQGVTGDAQTDA